MKPQAKTRQYEIDWIRIILILSVFIYHLGMIFNTWDWHIKSDAQVEGLTYFMDFFHNWRMSLLFLVSGAGTYYALGVRSFSQYTSERAKKLLIPFIAGIILLVPVQVYIEKSGQYPSLFHFYPHMFDGSYPSGNFSWHHLWFILYLFTMSLLAIPFIWFFRSSRGQKLYAYLERLAGFKGALISLAIPILLSQLILRPYYPRETHSLHDDWAFYTLFFFYFLYGYLLLSNVVIKKQLLQQRRLHLLVAFLFTIGKYVPAYLFSSDKMVNTVSGISTIFMSWTISLVILGYAQKYLRKDNPWRPVLNEAIYPFYLLHQPILIIVANYILPMNFGILTSFSLIMVISLILIITVYYTLVYPFNSVRVIFGMKPLQNSKRKALALSFAGRNHEKQK
ncbi:acyltransferase [Marinilabiliaceae bacterium JC017]|nr:acyltransferase [Marinilabiliaceae bacterium JC017]